jgi:hypothetical protein
MFLTDLDFKQLLVVSVSSSELGPQPTPFRSRVCLPLHLRGELQLLAGEGGGGAIRTTGQNPGTLYTLVFNSANDKLSSLLEI